RLQAMASPIGTSLFIPSGGLMVTGMFDSGRNRPPALMPTQPRPPGRYADFDEFRAALERSGGPVPLLNLTELGRFVLKEVEQERYLIAHEVDDMVKLLYERATNFGKRTYGPGLPAGLAGLR